MQYSGPLSDKQKSLLDQFKVSVKDILKPEYDDEWILRWIRAREWDLKKAEKMLRDSMAWRAKLAVDSVLDWQVPEVLAKYWAGNYFGHDKEGRPIWYEMLGYVDVRGLLASATKKDLIRYRIYTTEVLIQRLFPENSKKFGKRIDKVVFMFDMEGIGLKHLWKPALDIYTEVLATVEANYPETLGAAYVVNAPSILPILYNVIKPFLAEYTRSKIHFLGKNWKEVILNYIDADQLPVNWGGTCRDPDGDIYCKSKIGIGGTIPESYYLKNTESKIDLSQFTEVTVNRGSSTQVEVKVDQPGSILSWNFWTQNNDIGFGVYRPKVKGQQKIEDMQEIVEYSRVDCHMVPETGSVVCESAGTYIVWFDNSYSWMNAKKVHHLFLVLPPDKETKFETTTF